MQTFDDVLCCVIRSAEITPRQLAPSECQSPTGQRCKLCHAVNLDYTAELKLKNEALQKFWSSLKISLPLASLIPSPLGRYYRTTTKRKVFHERGSIRLGLISPNEEGGPFDVVQCAIEPTEHAAIYRQIQESIVKPYAKRLAEELNYVVIKGNYREQTIIFNVQEMAALRAANTLSKTLTKRFPAIVGLFVYEDSTSPQYYLGATNQSKQPKFKKLFGKPEIFQRVLGRHFLSSPLSFSQINQSIIEKMIRSAVELLEPKKQSRFYDLYCGYGLFALCLSEHAASVVGVEISPSSIESAIANARRQKVPNARFIRSNIDVESIGRVMKNSQPDDVVLLDPPRNGTAEGVIECIAARKPARVLHIFCEIDLIPKEMKRWEKSGYKAARAIPFDMFPGTATMETMILLEPKIA